MQISAQLLNRLPTTFILWAWPVARILLCGMTFVIFSASPPDASFTKVLQFYFLAWLGWTAAMTLLAIAGQPLRNRLLSAQLSGDAIMIFFAIILLRGAEVVTIAFALCVVVIALTIGLTGKRLFVAVAVGVCTFLLRDFALQLSGTPSPPINAMSDLSDSICQTMLLLAMSMVIISASRKYRLKLFNDDFSSLHTLAFEQPFAFDMQAWTNASAFLFSPRQAAYVLQGPTLRVGGQYHHCNLPILQSDQKREELINALENLPIGYNLFDTKLNRVIFPDTGHYRPFDDNDQRIAHLLRQADIGSALVQPLQIDNVKGGFICAVNSRIDPIIIAEASFLGRHVTEMVSYLGKVATSKRNFLANAQELARRDMHDGVLQTLAALRMRLVLLTKHKDVAQQPVELEIRKAADIITLEQSRLRGFLANSDADDQIVNLVSQIDVCTRTISLQWGIDVKSQSEEAVIPIDTESSFNIEHLLREVITNAVRHAKSKSLTVTLSLKHDMLMIAVVDLSKPLGGPQMLKKSALILKSASLRDRLRIINGEAYAEGLGKGTLLSIRIPMQQIDD